jgi:uncharacterized protein YjbI with pentapeptide repeats
MGARLRSWWLIIKQHPVASILIGLFIVLGVLVLVGGYKFNWGWTGFNSPSKTLWDWLQLLGVLAVPVVVGFGAVWFTTQQGKVADAENKDNQRETALQAYIDKMSELLLHEKLRDSAEDDEVRKIARVRTLTILPGLDGNRKGSVIKFLYESGLIDKDKCIITLLGADLSDANLPRANLNHTNLAGTTLTRANLSGAKFENANLMFANLSGADLSSAYLGITNLLSANLTRANLSRAGLQLANLLGADLSGAIVTEQQLKEAGLEGATMPDGSIHP